MRGITYIGPSSYFFKGTVRDNLLMGDPSASDERLAEVLRMCRMDTFPGGENPLDVKLTENAQNLSGGQRQRLALARALLHDSPVYIFDEATSNIDVESEQIIMERIRELAGQKTVILISHRLLNTREADRIFVMENGKLMESGNHRELMKWGGTYSVLWRMQQKLERFGRDDDSSEKWLTGEIDRLAATGELNLNAAAKPGDTGRMGDTRRIADTRQLGDTRRISDTGQIGGFGQVGDSGWFGDTGQISDTGRSSDAGRRSDTGRIPDTDLIGGNTGRIGDTGRIRIRKEGDHDAH